MPRFNRLRVMLEVFERDVIQQAYADYGTKSAAAEYLGISRQQLNNRMRKLGIQTSPPPTMDDDDLTAALLQPTERKVEDTDTENADADADAGEEE